VRVNLLPYLPAGSCPEEERFSFRKRMNILDRSALKTRNDLPYFEIPEITRLGWIQHGFLTRKGGVSPSPYDSLNLSNGNGDLKENVSQNRAQAALTFGFDLSRLVLLKQSHQDKILFLKEPLSTLPLSLELEYDAMIANAPDVFLGILSADCVPIFAVDQKNRVIAAIHAGRQGTALHITTKVLRKMKEEFGCLPEDLLIALGPSIGFCCYEIDERVFQPEWALFSISVREGKRMVDLARINIAQIEEEGIEEEQIFWVDLCTCCHHDLFFSYRKEGKTGRQLSFIGIV
jgi:YfiH family protein